jgi:hypothetical protein
VHLHGAELGGEAIVVGKETVYRPESCGPGQLDAPGADVTEAVIHAYEDSFRKHGPAG